MKHFFLYLSFVFFTVLSAQEVIKPLRYNSNLYDQSTVTRTSANNDLDSTFIYVYQPLAVQYVFDDFSTNKFETFSHGYADAGVASSLFYQLMDATNTLPQDPTAIFCEGEFAHHDTVKVDGVGALIERVTTYPFAPFDVFVNDLDFYPVVGELHENLYEECYVLIDSIIDGVVDSDQDTLWYNTFPGPAYQQDSARVFTKTVSDTTTIWIDNFACRNFTFAEQPWSLGVVTFDGVNQFGTPYEFGDLTAHGIADYLTSRPINLPAQIGTDIAYLDFIFQPEGYGNMPEANDTLLVEFYDPVADIWYKMPFAGIAPDIGADVWDTAHIEVPAYLRQNGFQFRLKNYASLSGALDHWHVDYLSLKIREGVMAVDVFSDVAISYPVNTLLKEYTAVPWDHYKNTTGNEKMRTDFPLLVYNSDNTPTNFAPGAWSVYNEGILEGAYPITFTGGPDAAQYILDANDCVIPLDAGFYYDQTVGGVQAKFDFTLNIAAAVDVSNKYRENDTTHFTQRFDNYYAYDDGSAEAAYGIEGSGALMAYKFEAYEAGALTGILMHFVPSVNDLSSEVFLLTVWADNDGEPGEIIYQDDYFESHSPEYSGGKNAFRYYTFTREEYLVGPDSMRMLPVPEIFYVGWRNIESPSLNIGLDWNIDNGDKVFRNTGGGWLTSSYEMSLMIRPVFSTGLNYTLSTEGLENAASPIEIYPNPTQQFVHLLNIPAGALVDIFDISGRKVIGVQNETQIDVSALENGGYIIAVQDQYGALIYSTKLIKN